MADKRPILFLSDAVSGTSGLARITRDISTRVHEHLGDVYRVASYGYGSPGSSKISFPQFVIEGMDSWVMPTLPQVCEDFFGKEKGIIFTVFDPSRLTWLAAPRGCSELFSKFPGLQQWAANRPFELWGYIPLDGAGPNDRLTFPLMKTLLGFDRLIGYGDFGADLIRRTIGDENSDARYLTAIPHGLDTDSFYEQDRKLSRKLFLEYTGARQFFHLIGTPNAVTPPIADDEVIVSILATNQSRKDWSLGLECAAILSRTRKIRVWLHSDSLERYWSLPNLLVDFGLLDRAVISLGFIPDNRLATGYTTSDITLGIGPEGYGYTIAESMACGTPCITGSYANNAALVHPGMLVDPVAFRYEGSYATKRPVYRAEDFAAKAEEWIGKRAFLHPQYDWNNLWPTQWEPWFREAAK